MNHADEDVKPFSRQGVYQAVYDIIEELPFYRAATALHTQWIRSIASRRPLVIEAGGGTGIMNAEARRVRRDADVYLLDINPAMAEQAERQGVPRGKIVVADVAEMCVRSRSADHIFSHSVVWALPLPDMFFAEAQRVLKSGGGLAVSTVGENLHAYRQCFISYLDKYLSAAVERGVVSPEQKRIFIEQNERVTEAAKSPLSSEQLRELGERDGFDVEVVTDCYVVDTLEGPRPYYHQILYRKR